MGAAYAGVVIVPMNPLYRASEVAYVLGKAGASACFVEPENRGASLWNMLGEAAAQVPSLRLRVAFGDAPDTAGPGLDEWIDAGSHVSDADLERRQAEVRPADTSQIQFTSGTTGFPKGAELNNAGIVNNARLFVHRAGIYDHGRHCNPMPFFHCGGCVMATLGMIATGSAQLPTLTFDAARMVRTIDAEQAAVRRRGADDDDRARRGGGPLRRLARVARAGRHRRLARAGGGGAPLDRALRRRLHDHLRADRGSPVITQSSPDRPRATLQIATCGPPLPHVEVDVVDPATRERCRSASRASCARAATMVMNGYWDNPEATARGDRRRRLAPLRRPRRMDENGYVSITGRAKEMIIRGGENIYPARDRERDARAHPASATSAWSACPTSATASRWRAFVRLPTAPR